MGTIKAILIMSIVLFGLISLYSFLNGSNMQETFWLFIKNEGLKGMIMIVFIAICALMIQKLSGVRLKIV